MFKVLEQLNVILKRNQKCGILILLIGAICIAVLDTAVIALMSPFMTLLADLEGFSESTFGKVLSTILGEKDTTTYLIFLSIAFIIMYLVRGVAKVFYNFWQARLLAVYRTDLSVRLFSYVMHKPYAYHLVHNTSETQRLVGADVESCFSLINSILLTISSGLVSLGIFAVLLSLNWKLTLILLIAIGIFIFICKEGLKKIVHKYADINYQANSEMNKWVSQTIGGLKNILVNNKQDYYMRKYNATALNAAVAKGNYLTVEGVQKVLIDTMCMILVFSAVLIELLLSRDILTELPMFATFAIAALRLIPVGGQITSTISSAAFYRPSVDAIYEILQSSDINNETQNKKDHNDTLEKSENSELINGVVVENLTFGYKDSTQKLYTNLSITIPAKKSVAIVGTTGAGKTTLADIILGLHTPDEGQVLADGINIFENKIWWGKMVGYIPQFIYLCDDTIRANVAFGMENKDISDAWVWECLERAQLKDFVEELPEKLDTYTGENGIRLSGGQRQRIGIARALYFRPQLLVMDEATSSLDGDTEKAIVDSINELSGDITLLIIAHRLSTIKDCDMIYRIENGKAYLEKKEKEKTWQ